MWSLLHHLGLLHTYLGRLSHHNLRLLHLSIDGLCHQHLRLLHLPIDRLGYHHLRLLHLSIYRLGHNHLSLLILAGLIHACLLLKLDLVLLDHLHRWLLHLHLSLLTHYHLLLTHHHLLLTSHHRLLHHVTLGQYSWHSLLSRELNRLLLDLRLNLHSSLGNNHRLI